MASEGRGGSGSGIRREVGIGGDENQRSREDDLTDSEPRLAWSKKSGLDGARSTLFRPGKRDSSTGWASLPPKLLSRIASFAWGDTVLHPMIQEVWGEDDQKESLEVIKLWLSRASMCDLRAVCRGWRSIIDNHPFWLYFALSMDSTPRTTSLIDDLKLHRRLPSDPKFPTHFDRTLYLTSIICMACRIDFPDAIIHRSSPHGMTSTSHLQYLPTCPLQYRHFCSRCLASDGWLMVNPKGHIQRSPTYSWDKISLFNTDPSDIDETGQRRRPGMICQNCRLWSLRHQIALRLKQVGGDEISRLSEGDLETEISSTDAAAGYIFYGQGTAVERSDMTLEEFFLAHNTQWTDLKRTAMDLQLLEGEFRDKFLEDGEDESPRDAQRRLARLAMLRGEPAITHQLVMEDSLEMRRLKMKWGSQLYDVYQENIDDEDDEMGYDVGDHLTKRWWFKLRDSAIRDWASNRVDLGYWMTPHDEVDQLRHEVFHSDRGVMATTNLHPYASLRDKADPTPYELWAQHDKWGWIEMAQTDSSVTPVFPAPTLLADLEDSFIRALSDTLTPPMRQIAAMVQALSLHNDEAEDTCAKWSLDDILLYLGKRETWIKGGLLLLRASEIKLKAIEREEIREEKRLAGQAARNTAGDRSATAAGPTLDDIETIASDGPRIELVLDEPAVVDYGIREVSTSSPATVSEAFEESISVADGNADGAAHQHTASDLQTSLGKRKEAPAEADKIAHKRPGVVSADIQKDQDQDPPKSPEGEMTPSSSPDDMDERQIGGRTPVDKHANGQIRARKLKDEPSKIAWEDIEAADLSRSYTTEKAGDTNLEDDEMSELTDAVLPTPSQNSPRSLSPSADKGPELVMSVSSIPWIPTVRGQDLGPRAGKIIMDLWYEVRDYLRVCHCKVCERRRQWDSWMER